MEPKNETRANLVKALQALQKTRQKLNALQSAQHEPIAVIGMACRFPGADSLEAFWKLLQSGADMVTEVPTERWNVDDYYDPVPGTLGKTYVREAAFLDKIDGFDPKFFGISPREAVSMDPQHRLLLEVSWEALERAGQAPSGLKNSKTGVFVGVSSSEYAMLIDEIARSETYVSTGNSVIFASGRLSYVLGLQGPNLVIDTACSASLIGVHLACESLRSGSSDLALVGGVHLMLSPQGHVSMSQMHALAPDGRCKTFDAAANGFGRGEGCGIVVLKRLSDALADHDNILALIRGTAINHDGPSSGLTVPSATAQAALIRQALENGKVKAKDVSYVEAHGTGTTLGDPIEIRALINVFGKQSTPLLVGSVKSNVGHLEEAAGIASLMKVILAMQHDEIPPHLHFHHPNPHIDWEHMAIRVPTERTEWPAGKKIAGVSSFGLGGSNAHVVVEQAPLIERPENAPERPLHLLTLSAKSKEALQALVERYRDFLHDNPTISLGDLCYTATSGRSHFGRRLSMTAASVAQLQAHLAAYAIGQLEAGTQQASISEHQAPRIAFLFTGQGSQYVNMGRDLYETSPTFRSTLERCDVILQECLGRSLIELLYPTSEPDHNDLMESHPCGQAANFAIECALVDLWRSWGIEPDMVLGHSLGDFAAAYTAGVLSLEDGLRLVSERGRLMETALGSMVSVMASEVEVMPFIAAFNDVTIGVINGPNSVVISGGHANVALVTQQLQGAGFKTRQLAIPVAAHSPMLEPVLDAFETAVRRITLSAPQIPVVSSMTGQLTSNQLTEPRYWRQHLRNTVRFADGVQTLYQQGVEILLEIGPKPTLLGMASHCLDDEKLCWLPSLRTEGSDWQEMLTSLGMLYTQGVKVDWPGFHQGYQRQKIVLPTYPFQRKRYWHPVPSQKTLLTHTSSPIFRLIEQGNVEQLANHLDIAQLFGDDENELATNVLKMLVEKHKLMSLPSGEDENAANIYDALLQIHERPSPNQSFEHGESYLSFGILPELVSGFSWLQAMTSPTEYPEHFQRMRQAQLEMRRMLFAKIDFASCHRVMDFGCGYGSDLIALAEQYAHLTLSGYTISAAQAQLGMQKVTTRELANRVQILHADSTKDPFPGNLDLVFGIEVAAHIADKDALLSNVRNHLNLGGRLVMADYIAHTESPIEHEKSSTYMVTRQEWIRLLSQHQLRLVSCIDISSEVINFLDTSDDPTNLMGTDETASAAIQAFNQTQHLLRRNLASYVLLTAEKENALSNEELTAFNEKLFAQMTRYVEHVPERWLYQVNWQKRPIHRRRALFAAEADQPVRRWLIFADEAGVGQQVASTMQQAGDQAVLIYASSNHEPRDDNTFVLEAHSSHAYEALLARLAKQDAHFYGVLYLWGTEPKTMNAHTSTETVLAALERGCRGLLYLTQALLQLPQAPPRLWVVTRGAQQVLPQDTLEGVVHASLWGMARVVDLEHPELQCTRIDLDGIPAGTSAGTIATTEQAEALYAELNASTYATETNETQIALRKHERYVARLERFVPQPEQSISIQPEGTYLITGGLRGIGVLIAKWLIEQGATHLLLLGRSQPMPDVQRQLDAWSDSGVSITVARADVTDSQRVIAVLNRIDQSHPLRGVIHSAGVLDDGMLLQQNWPRFHKVLMPKVLGAWHLHTLTKTMNLDFFVLFSSVAGLLGNKGQANHAAANAFLDAFAHYRRAEGLPALSMNWGAWAEVGAAANLVAQERHHLHARGMGAITPTAGVHSFARLLGQSVPQVAVVPIDWRLYQNQLESSKFLTELTQKVVLSSVSEIESVTEKEWLSQLSERSTDDRYEILARYLQREVATVMRLNILELDPKQPLITIGFDSLMAVQLRAQIKRTINMDVPVTKFIDGSSTEHLISYVNAQYQTIQPSRLEATRAESTQTESQATKIIEGVL